jgi:DNA polymerase-3 subunit epsilon
MIETPAVFVDVETTGADPRSDRITEVAVVEALRGEVVSEWSTLVNPGREIPAGIETLTGITNEMVASAPAFEDISLDLAARLGGRLFIAHNARFDYAFLRNEFKRAGLAFDSEVLCTVQLSRRIHPQERRHDLDTLIARHRLTCAQRHRAMSDARVLLDLVDALAGGVTAERFEAALGQASQRPQMPAGIARELLDQLPDAPGTYLFYDAAGTPLYAGRAGNLRTQVLADLRSNAAHANALRSGTQAGTLEWSLSAGPAGAALRELRLIETHAPRHNRSPRERRDAFALRWRPEQASRVVVADLVEEALDGDLFGPFRARADALSALRGLARAHRLCPIALGLESGAGPCSARRSGDCRGACIGAESEIAHLVRVGLALGRLRIPRWPFAGAVAIVEQDAARMVTEYHVARDWRHLGSARDASELAQLATAPLPQFDIDAYRILQRALRGTPASHVIDLAATSGPGEHHADLQPPRRA